MGHWLPWTWSTEARGLSWQDLGLATSYLCVSSVKSQVLDPLYSVVFSIHCFHHLSKGEVRWGGGNEHRPGILNDFKGLWRRLCRPVDSVGLQLLEGNNNGMSSRDSHVRTQSQGSMTPVFYRHCVSACVWWCVWVCVHLQCMWRFKETVTLLWIWSRCTCSHTWNHASMYMQHYQPCCARCYEVICACFFEKYRA